MPVATSYRRAPLVRPDASQLCRRSGPAGQCQIGGAGQGQRPGDRGGRAPERDHHPGLYAVRIGAQKLVHAYPEARNLAGCFAPIWPSMPRPRAFAAALDRLSPRAEPRWRGTKPRPPMPSICAWSDHRAAAGRGQSQRNDDLAARESSRRRHSLPTARAIMRPGFTASTVSGISPPISRRFRNPWAMACPPRWRCKRLYPQRRVISINGDGDFLMSGQEFATAVQYGLPIIALVLDNGMYGTIRMHQEGISGPGLATTLRQSRFRALGAKLRRLRRHRHKDARLRRSVSCRRGLEPARLDSCEIRCRWRGAGHNLKRRSRAGQSLIFPRRAAFPARRPPPRASARSRSWPRPAA